MLSENENERSLIESTYIQNHSSYLTKCCVFSTGLALISKVRITESVEYLITDVRDCFIGLAAIARQPTVVSDGVKF